MPPSPMASNNTYVPLADDDSDTDSDTEHDTNSDYNSDTAQHDYSDDITVHHSNCTIHTNSATNI